MGNKGRAGRWSALLLCATLPLSACDDEWLARKLFTGVEGLGKVRYARASKGEAPDGIPDWAGVCQTVVAELEPSAPVGPPLAMTEYPDRKRQFGGNWQPTPMPDGQSIMSEGCRVLWPSDMQQKARRALAEPGSFWVVHPRGNGRIDDQWSLYSAPHSIVAWARAGVEG
jgi:hypothetical protein